MAVPINLPFDSYGEGARVTQEPGAASHSGALYTSWDFELAHGHQVLAVAKGTVVDIRETVPDGDGEALPDQDQDGNPLNDDRSLGSGGLGNLVTIRHVVDGQTFYATYMHLRQDSVPLEIGDGVKAGQTIGLVGNTGSRTAPHLHFQVGTSTTVFGATNYGGWPTGTDNAKAQTIANAQPSEVNLVRFAGYGDELPEIVVGPAGSPAVFQLSSLGGTNGFRLVHSGDERGIGLQVASAGDMNKDGFDDFLIGGWNEGHPIANVVFGKSNSSKRAVDLAELDGRNGFRMQFEQFSTGNPVGGSIGDMNGDGLDDIIVSGIGQTYVVFGRADGFTETIEFSDLTGENGFRIEGFQLDSLGYSAASAGDVNGDGLDDVIVGTLTGSGPGYSFVLFGKANFAPVVDLNDNNFPAEDGFLIVGSGGQAGISVASAGDVNGDGFDDILVGAKSAAPGGVQDAGSAYVVFGKASGFTARLELSGINGTNGFRLNGGDMHGAAGQPLLPAGDVNGDGYDDVLVAAWNAANHHGETYIFFGKASGFTPEVELKELNGSNGFIFRGNGHSGLSAALAGDFNGDGFDDIIIDEPYGSPAGGAYLIFGKASGFEAVITAGELDGVNGFRIEGINSGDNVGRSVSSAGDINNDGFDDLLVGAPGANGGDGEAYVIFGHATHGARPLEGFRYPVGESGVVTETRGDDDYYQANDLGVRYSPSISSFHLGEDWHFVDPDVEIGKPVYALHDGEVVYAQFHKKNGFGNTVIIRHDLGTEGTIYSLYAHLSSIEVKEGRIDSGKLLGGIGRTGSAGENAHLHFEIFRGDYQKYLEFGTPKDGKWGYTANPAADFADSSTEITRNPFYVEGDFTWYNPSIFIDGHRAKNVNRSVLDGSDEVKGSVYSDSFTLNTDGAATTVNVGANGRDVVLDYVQGAKQFVLKLFEEIRYIGGAAVDILKLGSLAGTTIQQDTIYFEGKEGADILDGSATDRRIVGSGGTEGDRLTGGTGDDLLKGGGGADTIAGGSGNDTLKGGAGLDRLDGGSGRDTADYSGETSPITVMLKASGNTAVMVGGLKETIRGFENFRGGSGSDMIAGGSGANLLEGGDGDDALQGGGSGDTLIGGKGSDTASYAGARMAVTASLAKTKLNKGDAKGDTFSSIENLAGSSRSDKLSGSDGRNTIAGAGGKDALRGEKGADIFLFDLKLSTGRSRDTIEDFRLSQNDKIALDDDLFGGQLKADKSGHLVAGQFQDLSKGDAGRKDRILYDKEKGDLYFDKDGSGTKGNDPVLFAHLDAAKGKFPALDADDFLVV